MSTATSPTGALAERILEVATSSRLETLLGAAEIDHDAPSVREVRADLHRKLGGLRDLVAALRHPDDEAELLRGLAAFALELRCEWERHNLRMAYDWACAGRAPDPSVALAASATSGMFAWMEEVVPSGVLSALAESAVALIERMRADLAAGSFFPLAASAPH